MVHAAQSFLQHHYKHKRALVFYRENSGGSAAHHGPFVEARGVGQRDTGLVAHVALVLEEVHLQKAEQTNSVRHTRFAEDECGQHLLQRGLVEHIHDTRGVRSVCHSPILVHYSATTTGAAGECCRYLAIIFL